MVGVIDVPIRDGEEAAGSLKRKMSRRTVRMLKRWRARPAARARRWRRCSRGRRRVAGVSAGVGVAVAVVVGHGGFLVVGGGGGEEEYMEQEQYLSGICLRVLVR